jgi:hypothetical protein
MSTMVKRVAQALQQEMGTAPFDEPASSFALARAAIAAMRRAINQREPGWEKTLTGYPKELYDFWEKHLKARGYKVAFQIVDFPGGLPGDIGITLRWK